MQWRYIELDTHHPYTNMAIDEAVMQVMRKKKIPPTVRFYQWNPSALSLGFHQKIEKHVNLNECKEQNVKIVRRPTGGGAVFHDSDGEITYSVIAPKAKFPPGILNRFQVICGWIVKSLEMIGLSAKFKPDNDVLVDEKKISGSAQAIQGEVFLQHGTILYDVEPLQVFTLTKIDGKRLSGHALQHASNRITSIVKHKNVSKAKIIAALEHGFLADKSVQPSSITAAEKRMANTLLETKYSRKQWNFKR